MEVISFKKMFELLREKDIFFFEDDFEFDLSKNSIVYSLWRQNNDDRVQMMNELKSRDQRCFSLFTTLIDGFNLIGELERSEWNQIIKNEIDSGFTIFPKEFKEFKEVYEKADFDAISFDHVTELLLRSYGIGVKEPVIFKEIFDEYISFNLERKRFKVFNSFSADDQKRLDTLLSWSNESPVVVIIDNQLMQEQRVGEIVDALKKYSNEQVFMGAIFSSTTEADIINENFYLELVNKREPEKLQIAITKSAYSYVLRKLYKLYKCVLNEAFKDAIENRNIAYYLSNMAWVEGISNYQVITEWIKLLFENKLEDDPTIIELIRLSKLISMLQEDGHMTTEFSILNTYEVFETNINRYFEPIAVGDVFEGKDGKLYILMGQDCDMMFNSNRPEKNGVAELVEAEIGKQVDIMKEIKLNRDNVCINNFRKSDSENASRLMIKYKNRVFIDNQVLRLCQFNKSGQCSIHINKDLEDDDGIMPDYYKELHCGLMSFFNSLIRIDGVYHEDLFALLANNHSPRLVRITDYEYNQSEGLIQYHLTRVGKLRQPYAMYLYKVYLDHRGRHAFNTINMSRVHDVDIKVEDTDRSLNASVFLSNNRKVNRNDIRKLAWIFSKKDIENEVNSLLKERGKDTGTIICDDDDIIIDNNQSPYDKECILSGNRKVKLIKEKHSKLKIIIVDDN